MKGSPARPPEPLRRRHGLQRIEPHSGPAHAHLVGAGTTATAEWAGRLGVNLMSSTLLTEADGTPFDLLQAQQLDAFRAAWREADTRVNRAPR